jgi:hypothetical protein
MRAQNLIDEAQACRTHARTVTRSERDLLFKIADAFEEMAAASEARKAVAETRCW